MLESANLRERRTSYDEVFSHVFQYKAGWLHASAFDNEALDHDERCVRRNRVNGADKDIDARPAYKALAGPNGAGSSRRSTIRQ